MSRSLSKSKYCCGIQCPKMLWLHCYRPEEFDRSVMNEGILKTGNEVGDLAMGLFGGFTEVPYGDLSEMIKTTEELIRQGTPLICEASFSYDGCFCSVDILKLIDKNTVELYEVKSSTSLSDIYIHDVSYQTYVLTQLGFHVRRACLVHLNRAYVRHGALDLSQLFTIEDLTETAMEQHDFVGETIAAFKTMLGNEEEPEQDIGEQCRTPYQCGFLSWCTRSLPRPNVFDLRGIQYRTLLKLYRQSLISFEDLQAAGCLSEKPAMQVRHELADLPDQIDVPAVKDFLSSITYPLYYLDFETFQPAVPLYDDSSPFDQIPFQYSLHYQKRKNGKLYHREFLADPQEDPRRKLAEQLCRDIPADACVLAYNMSFEKGRIKALASLYPDLHDHLMKIYSNMKDLMIPFQQRCWYNRAMQGSYSIKYVLPALYPDDPELDYHNLEGVHNGAEASDAFRNMRTMDPETLKEYRAHLLKYCELDTYAMVKILKKLYEAI